MNQRAKSALLWGAVGLFAFLVLYQGYVALGNDGVGFLPALGVALVVGAAVAAGAYVAEFRLLTRGR
ncbi:hypothetical protein [Haloarchaeobius sp. HME9146]|uniref:hypothetical protein n=1 Tax=unclassified Haloarchaeobius TaxID=2614452 RepID=UPI0021C01448|nr:hypothetical protein [Haloarchaeobius sp. HME9146]MCT9094544.1 hypothetical protein [Haloarchaeobius sp. HME9146]